VRWQPLAPDDAQRHQPDQGELSGHLDDDRRDRKARAPEAHRRYADDGFERRVWRLHAVVDRYRIASNGEIVLILFSIASAYMNVYLPNPVCLGQRARSHRNDRGWA
jgi:hypothetical protein